MQVSIPPAHLPPRQWTPAARSEPLDLLEQFGITLHLHRNHEIHSEGDAAIYCYRMLRGCVHTVRILQDGRRQVGEFLLAGDTFGLDDLEIHVFAAQTVTEVVLRRYPRRMVEALAKSSLPLSHCLRHLAIRHLRTAQELMLLLCRKKAAERVAYFLLDIDRRTSRAAELPVEPIHGAGLAGEDRHSDAGRGLLYLPMSRADIADHLGLTVETVCRVLAGLKRDGSIQVSRAGLKLLNHPALRDIADGSDVDGLLRCNVPTRREWVSSLAPAAVAKQSQRQGSRESGALRRRA